MPELPDITAYLESVREHLLGDRLTNVRVASPFLVRSVTPPLRDTVGRSVASADRLGKRIVLGFEGDLYWVIHLMIAGRLRYREPTAKIPAKVGLAAFDFERGTLLFTEASSKKRASLYVVQGREGLGKHDPGGIDPLTATFEEFAETIRRENHTIKRTLTDPRFLSGIGNAYSDEILHRARLSPLVWTSRLSEAQARTLYDATRAVLTEWIERLRAERAGAFPEKVTAFHDGMAVHGKYRKPCPVCGSPVQRIVYAENETNYCPTCQNDGKLLADRSLSRLLHGDWPKTLDELEALRSARRDEA